ncbi:hypothetical protein BD408DRAFT_419664 [Parasitella parasitica]|nr:hypothetical protein BD408DRAFT_419664 [Parasitella parasitica]
MNCEDRGVAPLQINIEWPQQGSSSSILPSASIRTFNTDTTAKTTTEVLSTTQKTPRPSSSASYRLSTNVYTLTDLYREWTEGLGGNHSVVYMNANHPGWYSSHKSFYMRRRKIIKACEDYAAVEGITVLDAVRRAEMLRVRNKKSLDYLSKNSDLIFTLL